MTKKAKLCLLGSVCIVHDCTVHEQFKTTKIRDIFTILGIAPGNTIDRKSLISLLWPDDRSANGPNRLSVTLYLLRKELDAIEDGLSDAIIRTAGALRLDTDRLPVDVVEFRAAVAGARRAGGRTGEEYAAAFDLVTGPLASNVDHRWIDLPRVEVERMYQEAALWLASNADTRAEAKKILQRCVEADPWSDSAAELLIRWHLEAGELDEAQAYAQQILAAHAARESAPSRGLQLVLESAMGVASQSGMRPPYALPVITTCACNAEAIDHFRSVCNGLQVSSALDESIAVVASPVTAHEVARLVISAVPQAKIIIHTEISEPANLNTNRLRELIGKLPNGIACVTEAAGALLEAYSPGVVEQPVSNLIPLLAKKIDLAKSIY